MTENIPILYHYCSVDAFLSIIKNKSIRLHYLGNSNDSYELKQASRIIYNILTKKKLSKVAITFDNLLEKYLKNESYAFCLSENGDLLSQWRGYGDDGKGISIGFDLSTTNGLLGYTVKQNFLSLEKVIYYEKEQTEILEKEFPDILQLDLQELINIYNKFASLFKHDSFSEEKEWRLIFNNSLAKLDQYTEGDINIKIGMNETISFKHEFICKNNLVSGFFELSLINGDITKLIKEVILGPKCLFRNRLIEDKMHREHYLKKFLKANNCEFYVNNSSASYR